MEEKNYQDLLDTLEHCEEGSEEEFEIYKQIAVICEDEIKKNP